MFQSFGPWTTNIDAGGSNRLNTLWKTRMAMLPYLSSISRVLARADVVRLALIGIALMALPLLRSQVQAERAGPDPGTTQVDQLSGSQPPPRDNTTSIRELIDGLRQTEAAIRNLSVTTKYVKLQQFLLPVREPVRMELVTKAIVDHTGRAWNDCVGEQVNIEPNGKDVRIYKGRWRGAFDGKVARQMSAYGEGGFTRGSLTNHLSWHGINPREFTTHYFRKPVSELLETPGATVAKRSTWDERPVIIIDTIPRGATDKRKYRFWIDLERNIVVRRALLIQFKPDQKWQEYTRIESHSHKQIKPGLWLPMRVKYESVEVTADLKPEKLSWSYTGTNSDWKVNQKLPKETFVLKFPDNVRVQDHHVRESKKDEPAPKERKKSGTGSARSSVPKSGEPIAKSAALSNDPNEYAVWLGRWQAEQKPIEEIKKLGGSVKTEVCAPESLHKQLGEKRSRFVTLVNMHNQDKSDQALQHMKHFTQLKRLLLTGTQATDENLKHLTGLRKLELLYMWNASKVTDKGFVHVRKMPSLTYIHCSYSGITDDALAGLKPLKHLIGLDLPGNQFTDKALANVSELTNLKVLTIVAGEGGNITDDGLKHLKNLTKLESLNLMATSVTDEGIDHLKQMKNLKTLWLSATAVTADGASELQQALPKLRIMR